MTKRAKADRRGRGRRDSRRRYRVGGDRRGAGYSDGGGRARPVRRRRPDARRGQGGPVHHHHRAVRRRRPAHHEAGAQRHLGEEGRRADRVRRGHRQPDARREEERGARVRGADRAVALGVPDGRAEERHRRDDGRLRRGPRQAGLLRQRDPVARRGRTARPQGERQRGEAARGIGQTVERPDWRQGQGGRRRRQARQVRIRPQQGGAAAERPQGHGPRRRRGRHPAQLALGQLDEPPGLQGRRPRVGRRQHRRAARRLVDVRLGAGGRSGAWPPGAQSAGHRPRRSPARQGAEGPYRQHQRPGQGRLHVLATAAQFRRPGRARRDAILACSRG